MMFFQAEKSTLALHKHHPELRDVWGDIERDLVIPTPQRGTPPPNLKVTLLPFQLESLHWMKIQEQSIWTGGLLAVCASNVTGGIQADEISSLGRDGVRLRSRLLVSHLMLLPAWGKRSR